MQNREIDRLVAEKVLKEKVVLAEDLFTEQTLQNSPVLRKGILLLDSDESELPSYSCDIGSAMDVVRKFSSFNLIGHGGFEYFAELFDEDGVMFEAKSETLPMAICLAALDLKNADNLKLS